MKPWFNRSRLYAWHSWLGLITGAFLILIGFSGALAVFKHEIDWLATPALRVAPKEPAASVDRLLSSLQARYPGGKIEMIWFQEDSRSAHEAHVRTAGGERLEVHLDPHTAEVRGERRIIGQVWPLSNLIRQFHVRLLMGFWGRVFVGAFGGALFLSCLTGLYVYRNWIKTFFRVRLGLGLKLLVSDLHKSVGLFSLVFNLIIAATGAVLGLENLYNKARHDWLGIQREERPKLSPEILRSLGDSAQVLPLSRLLESAAQAFPEMKPGYIQFPRKRGEAVVIAGHPIGMLVTRNSCKVAIDPFGGVVLKAEREGKGSLSARMYDLVEPLHFGNFGGRVRGRLLAYAGWFEYGAKVIWCILGMAPGLLAISGFYLWFSRKRPKRRSPKHPDREALTEIILPASPEIRIARGQEFETSEVRRSRP